MRILVVRFAEWYNTEPRHSGLKCVTPRQCHYGQADAICAIRRQTYDQAVRLSPQRWNKGPRDWIQPKVVEVNPPRRMQPRETLENPGQLRDNGVVTAGQDGVDGRQATRLL